MKNISQENKRKKSRRLKGIDERKLREKANIVVMEEKKNQKVSNIPTEKRKNDTDGNLIDSEHAILHNSCGRLKKKMIEVKNELNGIKKLNTGSGRYRASIVYNKQKYNLGDYDSTLGAACSYDQAKLHIFNDCKVSDTMLNFDWYAPNSSYEDTNTIRNEYIRMITKHHATRNQQQDNKKYLHFNSTKASDVITNNDQKMKLGYNNNKDNCVLVEQGSIKKEKNEIKAKLEKQVEREAAFARYKLEESRRKNWWFNSYLGHISFNSAEVDEFLSRPEKA